MSVPTSLPCQHLLLSIFLTTAILVSVRWYLAVVSTCVSLVTRDAEHLFSSFFVLTDHLRIIIGGVFAVEINMFIILVVFPDSSVGKESICSSGDPGLIPALGRSPGEGHG